MQGYIILDHADRLPAFLAEAPGWVADGRLRWRETVVEGIERMPEAFVGLLRGDNVGKMLVKVGGDLTGTLAAQANFVAYITTGA